MNKMSKMSKMQRTVSVLAISLASPAVLANEFVCKANSEVRMISVEYEHKGWQLPCRVKYEKPAQGLTEYPWTAQAVPDYCEDKARFLASKLEKLGWTCEEQPPESEEP